MNKFNDTIKLDWNDITIIPAVLSDIDSRSEINPFNNGKLPLFTAPMDTVIDKSNINKFEEVGFNICLPRHIKYEDLKNDNYFYSYGLDEIIDMFNSNRKFPKKILCDIANGHMLKLYNISKSIKEKFGNEIELMVGNIANPETYRKYCEIGVDYIRCGIGAGSACFVNGSLVRTDKGYKKIEDINNEDFVITHRNKINKVINKISYNTSEDSISVNGNISITDHHYYIVDKIFKDVLNDANIHEYAKWVPANELDKDKHFLIKLKNRRK